MESASEPRLRPAPRPLVRRQGERRDVISVNVNPTLWLKRIARGCNIKSCLIRCRTTDQAGLILHHCSGDKMRTNWETIWLASLITVLVTVVMAYWLGGMLIVLVINYLLPFLGTSKELDLQSDFVYTGLVSAIASTYFLIVFSIKRKKRTFRKRSTRKIIIRR